MGLSRDGGRCFQVPDRTGPDSDLAEVLGLCPKSNRKELRVSMQGADGLPWGQVGLGSEFAGRDLGPWGLEGTTRCLQSSEPQSFHLELGKP